MALPAQTTDRDSYQVKPVRNVINIVATAAFSLGDYVASGPWHGVVLNSGVTGENMSVRIEEGYVVSTDTLESGEDTFNTLGQQVFYKASTGTFSDTSTTGYRTVGWLSAVKSSDGVIEFEKTRYAGTV